MSEGIIKQSDAKAASFLTERQAKLGVELVTDLIKSAIKASEPITQEAIMECYWQFRSRGGTSKVFLNKWEYNSGNYKKEVNKEEFKSDWRVKNNSFTWFRANLGSAIIHGKLLVVPIIEIE